MIPVDVVKTQPPDPFGSEGVRAPGLVITPCWVVFGSDLFSVLPVTPEAIMIPNHTYTGGFKGRS